MTSEFIIIPDAVWEMKLKPKELVCYMCHVLMEQQTSPVSTAMKAAFVLTPKEWQQSSKKLLELNMIQNHPTKKTTILTNTSEWKIPD